MKLLSVSVGLPRDIEWRGKTVRTSIFKSPVAGRVRVRTLNVEGDRQADLSVHGGIDKAVYAYPSEHYAFWREELPGVDLPPGAFGENFTTEGLLEGAVRIGDRLRVGAAEAVIQDRRPLRASPSGPTPREVVASLQRPRQPRYNDGVRPGNVRERR
jgi:MOSC domain-containing protein YiiM